MGERQPRADEQGALDAICAVEDVIGYEWLCESRVANVRTPDLRVTLPDGVRATVEIVMATLDFANRLRAAAQRMQPKRFPKLSLEWTVLVSDHNVEERSPSRKLKELVAAMVPVFAEAEARGGSPQAMMDRAQTALDPKPYGPNRGSAIWRGWMASRPWAGDHDQWVTEHLADHCPYWYPLDIVDWWTKGLLPRWVDVGKPPAPAGNRSGGIHVHVGTVQKAFMEGEVHDLVPAVQQAINKKEQRRQMADVAGQKWLAVPLDGNNAAAQLEGAFGPTARLPHPDLTSIRFSGFDQVWLIAKTFHGNRFVVLLRLFSTEDAPRCYTVDRPSSSR